jgi:hypothetical protein
VKGVLFFVFISALWVVDGEAMGPDDIDSAEAVMVLPESSAESINHMKLRRNRLRLTFNALNDLNEDNFQNTIKGELESYIALIGEKIGIFEVNVAENRPEFNENKLDAWLAIRDLMIKATKLGQEALHDAQEAHPVAPF